MATKTNSIKDMSKDQLELHCRQIAGGRSKAGADSFRTLRLASGFSQEKTGQMCNRQPNSISDWELNVSWPNDPEITFCKLLSGFGVPTAVLMESFGTDIDETLSVKSYLANDPIHLEHWWFRSKRGKVLSQLGKKCEQGSHAHMRLFFELLEKNQDLVNSSLSSTLNNRTTNKLHKERAKWLEQSKGSSSEPKPNPKPSLEQQNGSQKETPEPSTDSDVQPSDIPGV